MRQMIKKSFKREILLCFVILALLPLLLSNSFLIQVFKTSVARDEERRAYEQIEKVESKLLSLFQEFDRISAAMSKNELIIDGITETDGWIRNKIYTELYSETSSLRELAQFSIYDGEGNCRFFTDQVILDHIPTYWGTMKVAKAHAGEVVIRNVTEYTVSNDLILQSVRSIYDASDECVGYLVMDMSSDNFERLLQSTFETQSELTIVDNFWEEVYSTETARKEGVASILRERRMAGEAISQQSDAIRFFMKPVGDTGLFVVLGRTPVFTDAITRQMFFIMLVLAGITLVLCLILAEFMSVNLSRPIQKMTRAMSEAENGNLNARIETRRVDEFGELSRNFNRMTSQLKSYMELQVRQQKELNDANISMMQAQLNPHFLYNTLDTMKWVAKVNHIPELATMSSSLAKILRTSISEHKFIPLEEELQLVESYVEIQKIRFFGNFTFDMEVPMELEECIVPKLIVQPIVENAILHGLEGKADGHIFLNALEKNGILQIEVSDDGCGMAPEITERLNSRDRDQLKGHLGFYNVDTIISLYYGAEYGVHAENLQTGGTKVTITLPVRRTNEKQ
ncbi:MAG: sensor histidine kinase [Lachnospiraceae bacterium]|nr:sensor histidine kinase [Lachnospiraceae bacterium]